MSGIDFCCYEKLQDFDIQENVCYICCDSNGYNLYVCEDCNIEVILKLEADEILDLFYK
jgi:hypothetical protein